MSDALAAASPQDLAAVAEASFEAFAEVLAAVMADRSPARLRAALAKGCWVHGAGLFGRRLATLLQAQDFPVLGFIDRRGDVHLSSLMDLPVLRPDALDAGQARNRTFVGGVLNPGAASQDVLPWAGRLPFADFILGADLPDALGEGALTCWQAPRRLIHQNLPSIRRVVGRLADRASLDAYMGLLMYRITGEAIHHPAPDIDNPYLPPDLPGFDAPITFVDAGAYTGDTCAHLLRRGVDVSRYVAFEPDRSNFARLSAFARAARIGDATLFPCGLSNGLRAVQMEGEGVSCRIVEGGANDDGRTILCVALDEVLPGLAPDFVKMDIEGSELAALEGMVGALRRGRPRLAISIYHRPEDLWVIPEWVGRSYERLYVRQHGAHGFDTVLYALP